MIIFTVRLRDEDARALRALAEAEERSRGDLIRRLVRQAYRDMVAKGLSPTDINTKFESGGMLAKGPIMEGNSPKT